MYYKTGLFNSSVAKIMEIENCAKIKNYTSQLTGDRTVPSVFIG